MTKLFNLDTAQECLRDTRLTCVQTASGIVECEAWVICAQPRDARILASRVAIIYSIGGFHFTRRILSVSAVRILMYDRVAFMCVADHLQGASCSLPISVRVIQPCSAIQLRSRVAPSIYEFACMVIHIALIRVSRHIIVRYMSFEKFKVLVAFGSARKRSP